MKIFGTTATTLFCLLCVACAPGARQAADAPLRLNDIQVLGSHNSYKLRGGPSLLTALAGRGFDPAGIDYGHLPLTAQLDRGIRKLELDVFLDPEGGRYAEPLGNALVAEAGLAADAPHDPEGVLRTPGLKVLHVQDVDFRSTCLTFDACLGEIDAWSRAHPQHLPLVVSINPKDAPLPGRQGTIPLPFDSAGFDQVDAAIRARFDAHRLITPDEIRGDAATLRSAVLQNAWPTLQAARGRLLFVLDAGQQHRAIYIDGHRGLGGRVMFANFPPDHPAAAFLVINDPVADGARIAQLVRAGFLVRTRADADTREARSGDTRRREAAFASGAQFISTDYYVADPQLDSGYVVALPGGGPARCNPVRRPDPDCRVPPP